MKVVSVQVRLIHRYFWPDTPPYARFLRAIGDRWAAEGHDVEVISSQPGYNATTRAERRDRIEELGRLTVRRVRTIPEHGPGPRQLANLGAFPAAVAARLSRGRAPDLVMCSTAPQVTLGSVVSRVARRRGSAFVYHCMDLHPEIGVLSGEFAHPLVRKTLLRLDTATMRRADAVVVLSEDMREAVVARDPRLADRTVVINNFSLPDDGDDAPSPLPPADEGVLRVVFTGNLGRFQGLPDLVAALGSVPKTTPIEMVFMGEGKARADLEAAASALQGGPHRVLILPAGPVASAKALMRDAHVGIVSLVPEVVRFAYPSKTATYAEQSLPILVVVEADSELSRTVAEEALGWCAAPGDLAGITAALTTAAAELREGSLDARRQRIGRYARTEFDEQAVLDRWSELLRTIHDKRKAIS